VLEQAAMSRHKTEDGCLLLPLQTSGTNSCQETQEYRRPVN